MGLEEFSHKPVSLLRRVASRAAEGSVLYPFSLLGSVAWCSPSPPSSLSLTLPGTFCVTADCLFANLCALTSLIFFSFFFPFGLLFWVISLVKSFEISVLLFAYGNEKFY